MDTDRERNAGQLRRPTRAGDIVQIMFKTALTNLKQHPVGLVASALGFIAMFLVYVFTQWPSGFSNDPSTWPFGTDMGAYVYGDGRVTQHPISGRIVWYWRDILSLLGLPESHTLGNKVPYAAMGAASFVVFAHIFHALFKTWRAWLFAGCVGFSLMVWYYAGTPESYALTTFLYAAYLYCFVRCTEGTPSYLFGGGAAAIMFLAFVNDVSAPILLIVPVAYFGLKAVTDTRVRNIAFMHIGALVAGLICLTVLVDLFGEYTKMANEYTPFEQDGSGVGYNHGLIEPILNYFFFSLAAPAGALTYTSPLFPDYVGFFQPNMAGYFLSPFRLLFLILYLAPLWYVRHTGVDRVILAMLAFALTRFVAILLFNPSETIIYTSVVALPVLAFVFFLIERSDFKYKTPYATLFLLALLGSNVGVLGVI